MLLRLTDEGCLSAAALCKNGPVIATREEMDAALAALRIS